MSHDAVGFCRLLRDQGLAVPADTSVAYVAALGVVDLDRVEQVYWAGRATLVRRFEDVAVYDTAFERFFLGVDRAPATMRIDAEIEVGFDVPDESPGSPERGPEAHSPTRTVRFSSVETLRDRDFATCDPDELAELYRAIDQLRWHAVSGPSRRLVADRHHADRLDLRRTVSAAMRTDGELLTRRHRRRSTRPRRLVLLLDVSGSMEPYARALARFAHAAVTARTRVEVFTLGTRLTRLTREMATRDPDVALMRAADAVRDWSGGTRLGDGLAAFSDEWGQRGMARGAIVVILSDGWDRGDPDELGRQMARLGRLAHSIVWVNPLRASPGYEPLARGMAAALPYCDRFVDGHSLGSLEALAALVAGGVGRP